MALWKNGFFGTKRIYADAAAATPLSASAKRELLRLLELYGNPGALHREGTEAKRELEAARTTLAEAIGAHADEIVFTASGTEANNLAIAGMLRPLLRGGQSVHALTTAIEHQSVLEPLRALQGEGLELTELAVDQEGFVAPKVLAEAVTEKTALISVQLINSEVGTIQPIKEIAKEVRRIRKGREGGLPLYVHVDASQAPLWLSVGVEQLGIDLMTLDGQKVLGPKGVGALYIKRGVALEPILRGGGQERGLRGGTENTPLAGSFAAALADAQQGAAAHAEKTAAVRDFLFASIRKRIKGVLLNGPALPDNASRRVPNNLNISIPGLDGEMAVIALDVEGISASTRSACSAGDEGPSHVIAALGVPQELSKTAIRITLLPSASVADARRIARTLARIAKRYRTVV